MWSFNQKEWNIAVTENGEELTSHQQSEFNDTWQKQLPTRSLIFILCENTLGALAGYIACIENKIAPLLLSDDLDDELLNNLVETYHPTHLWVSKDKKEKLKGIGKEVGYKFLGYTLVKTGLESYPLYDNLALLLTTSGSTGSPKLVRQSYENIRSNAESIVEYLELTEDERPITSLPMNYTYGLSIINSHLMVGATLLMTDKGMMQKEFWQFFKEQNATSLAGVPYHYEMLKRLRFMRMDLPSLRYLTQAGGKLSPELHEEFARWAQETGRRFYVMYGQTEATARMSYLPYQDALRKYGSMGISIPGGAFSLIDVDGSIITEPEVIGELVYDGPNVTLGYAECGEDLAKGDERHGRLVTGDMAKRDAEGYYTIVGRKKRFVKLFGNRVNLDETEHMIKKEFSDLDCACAGRDDLMKIFITDEAQLKVVKNFVSKKTGIHFSAFDVLEINAIPKNDAGKTLYKDLPL